MNTKTAASLESLRRSLADEEAILARHTLDASKLISALALTRDAELTQRIHESVEYVHQNIELSASVRNKLVRAIAEK